MVPFRMRGARGEKKKLRPERAEQDQIKKGAASKQR